MQRLYSKQNYYIGGNQTVAAQPVVHHPKNS